jgi:hypothetical protein
MIIEQGKFLYYNEMALKILSVNGYHKQSDENKYDQNQQGKPQKNQNKINH